MTSLPKCTLCSSNGTHFHYWNKTNFFRCTKCNGIYIGEQQFISSIEEKERYLEHNNDVEDKGYQAFVSPITDAVQQHFSPDSAGLDFGSGTGPVLSKLLSDKNYRIKQYDPFFNNQPELLEQTYDYIASCEVIEHFHKPLDEFKLLKKLLRPEGILFCKTELFSDDIDFDKWYYKNDPTHVFIYHADSLKWVCNAAGFKKVDIKKKLITFYN